MNRIFAILFVLIGLLPAFLTAQSLNPNRISVEPECAFPVTLTDSAVFLIQFENTTPDTVTSLTLQIALDSKLDTTTFGMMGASHPYQVNLASNGVVIWTLDSLVLPPNSVNLSGSQGYVEYHITPGSNFLPLDTIRSQATIHFDSTGTATTNSVVYYQKRPWCCLDLIRPVTCTNGNDAWVRVTTRDFGPGLEYSLDSVNWQSSPDFMNVGNGMYRGHARDSLGNYDPSLGIWLPNAQPLQPGIFFANDTFSTGPWATFQWKLDNVPIPGATDQFFVPWFTGWYSVTVTDTIGCFGTSEDSLYIFVSREPAPTDVPIRLFPNPAEERVFLDMGLRETEALACVLYDQMGKCQKVLSLSSQGGYVEIELSGIRSGWYAVELQAKGQVIWRGSILKQ